MVGNDPRYLLILLSNLKVIFALPYSHADMALNNYGNFGFPVRNGFIGGTFSRPPPPLSGSPYVGSPNGFHPASGDSLEGGLHYPQQQRPIFNSPGIGFATPIRPGFASNQPLAFDDQNSGFNPVFGSTQFGGNNGPSFLSNTPGFVPTLGGSSQTFGHQPTQSFTQNQRPTLAFASQPNTAFGSQSFGAAPGSQSFISSSPSSFVSSSPSFASNSQQFVPQAQHSSFDDGSFGIVPDIQPNEGNIGQFAGGGLIQQQQQRRPRPTAAQFGSGSGLSGGNGFLGSSSSQNSVFSNPGSSFSGHTAILLGRESS
ncbi:hypothetical protein BV898_07510 [Hypsibius exemplaris]|uniref:Uncharacterized protein n=1 Tax=Hypsibius exemplaris TaxID=2072580 RepID=A0A1W0WTI4_HYPEX|nr:hypothetical protein BV898_07510 [Hypsibius exemplaris]